MPKIKLSALASDIKGKSQGSVFSTNSGGTYFRNNPSGGGRKTAQSAAQKNRFGSLATRWKALTNEQRTQWRESASAYPTINAFGDSRIPSGYELFMRLNGVLISNDLPLLTVPGTSREIPLIEGIDIISPDLWMFTPNTQFKTNLSKTETVFAANPTFFQQENLGAMQTLAVRTSAPEIRLTSERIAAFAPIFLSQGVDDLGFCLSLCVVNSKRAFLRFVFNCPRAGELDGSMIQDSAEFDYIPNESYHFAVQYLFRTVDVPGEGARQTHIFANLFLNGRLISANNPVNYDAFQILLSSATMGDPIEDASFVNQPFYDGSLSLGMDFAQTNIPFTFSDFAYLVAEPTEPTCCDEGGGECAPDFVCEQVDQFACECWYVQEWENGTNVPNGPYNVILLSQGYYIGSERARVGLNKVVSFVSPFDETKMISGFINEANDNDQYNLAIVIEPECETNEDCNPTCGDAECQDGVCVYVGDGVPFVVGTSTTYVPWVYAAANSYEESGFYVQLLCTGAMSAGKSEFQTKYKKLLTYPLNSDALVISEQLKTMFGGLAANCTYSYKARIIDGTTGVAYDTDIPVKKPRNPRRFKAGAELSGKVT